MTKALDFEEVRNLVLDDIVCCYNCCKPLDPKYSWVGDKCCLKTLFTRHKVNQKYWRTLINGLRCPICKAELQLSSMVEVITEYDRKVEKLLHQSRDSQLIQELEGFHRFLSIYPYLGLGDPNGTGQKIRMAIQKHPRKILDPEVWFRARRLKEGHIFTSAEMGAPDSKKVPVGEGRYNHTGQSFLYLASDPETAHCEINNWDDETSCAMQKFRATDKLEVLDLRHDDRKLNLNTDLLLIAVIYNGYLEFIPDQDTSWRPEYFVPRFLADCARLEEFEAIWFSSVWDFGENLVVFPKNIPAFVFEGRCEIFNTKVKTLRI